MHDLHMRVLMRRVTRVLVALTLTAGGTAGAQEAPAAAERIQRGLPAESAERILRLIDGARARGLPAVVLERRALELMAKHVRPGLLERELEAHAARLAASREALAGAGIVSPSSDEVAAAAIAIGKGADERSIADVSRSARPGRSLVVPLTVLASLLDRGLPVGEALSRLQAVPERGPGAPGQGGLDIAGAAAGGARGRGGPPAFVPIPGRNVPRPVDPADGGGPSDRPPSGPPEKWPSGPP